MAAVPDGRETRLLLVTLGISAILLLLLAQLRFPAGPAAAARIPESPAAPLERLAARATYEELASILRGVDQQLATAILPVRVAADMAVPDSPSEYVAAIRISASQAIALLGLGRRVIGVIPESAGEVAAIDASHGLVVIDTESSATLPEDASPDTILPGPGYLAAVEATRSGPAIRPLYFGRADRVTDPRWTAPVIRLSALQQMLPAGAAVFTLDGRFVGAGIPDQRDFLIVPAAVLRAEAARVLQRGSIAAADLAVEVQRLDAGLRAATGADSGILVTYVGPKGPSDGALIPGDVITRIADLPIANTAEYAAAVMALAPGIAVPIDVRRAGRTLSVSVTPSDSAASMADGASGLGLELQIVRAAGSEVVRVAPRSAAAAAGLRAGDLITAMDDRQAPAPARIADAFRAAPAGTRIMLMVERGAIHVALVLRKP